jgi:hypothetical protein
VTADVLAEKLERAAAVEQARRVKASGRLEDPLLLAKAIDVARNERSGRRATAPVRR